MTTCEQVKQVVSIIDATCYFFSLFHTTGDNIRCMTSASGSRLVNIGGLSPPVNNNEVIPIVLIRPKSSAGGSFISLKIVCAGAIRPFQEDYTVVRFPENLQLQYTCINSNSILHKFRARARINPLYCPPAG